MDIKEFSALALNLFEEAGELLQSKNEDYAKSEDAFKNLNRTSRMVEILDLDLKRREHVALYEVVKKVHRLVNLGDREPRHESIRNDCVDIINYIALYYGMMGEEKK